MVKMVRFKGKSSEIQYLIFTREPLLRNVETENLYQFDDELVLDDEGNIIGKWQDDEEENEDENDNISEYANFLL